mgnify:CR=1 FL=1
MARVAVVGGGIVGCAAASWLMAEGHAVTVYERDPEGRPASTGNAGVIALPEISPLARPGVITQTPRWLLDPLGPLAVRARDLPALTPWLLRFIASARPNRVEKAAAALAWLMSTALSDHQELARRSGMSGHMRRTGALYVTASEAGYRAAKAEWDERRRHGVPAEVGGTPIALVPLGLTVLFGAILAAVARRFAARTWGSWLLAVATYAAGVGVVASLVAGPDLVVRATAVATLLAGTAVAIGIGRAPGVSLGWLVRIPAPVRTGVRRGAATMALMLSLAAATGVAWVVVGRLDIADAATSLDLDGVGGAVLAVSETAYVPTMAVWLLAWLSGQGFSVGLGTAYAPDALTAGPLPVVPVLGALPSASGGLLVWAPVLLVAVAMLVRVAIRRPLLTWREDLTADAVAIVAVATAAAGLLVSTTGAIGPGRLETVGADPLATTVAVTALAAAGTGIGAGVVRGLGALAARVRGRRDASTRATADDARGATAPTGG